MNASIISQDNSTNQDIKKEENIEKMQNKIDKTESILLEQLGNLYNEINKDNIDLNNVQSSINSLSSYNNKQEYNYLSNLLNPEKCKGGKIPSAIPIPSCAFQ